jgi:ABC-type nitrate/sulfonate/bicarbonate transport system substrate-binding protein
VAQLRVCLAAVVLCVVGLTACGGSSKPKTQAHPKLNIGYAYSYDAGDVGDRVALARLAAAHGIKLGYRATGGPTNAIAGLVHGDINLANVSYLGALEAIRQGAPVRALLGSNMASEYLFVGKPGVSKPAQLVGKRVAFDGPGQDGEALVKLALQRAQVPAGKVHFSALQDSPVRAAALGSKRIDATELEYVDYHRLAAKLPGLTVLGRMTDFKPAGPQTVWVVKRSWAQQHAALLKTVVAGLLDGYRFVYSPAGKAAWIKKADETVLAGDSPDLVSSTYDYYRSIGFWPRPSAPVTAAIHKRLLAFWRSTGQLDGGLPFARMWPSPR